jgi:Ca2+-binding RTX toxin-like protein
VDPAFFGPDVVLPINDNGTSSAADDFLEVPPQAKPGLYFFKYAVSDQFERSFFGDGNITVIISGAAVVPDPVDPTRTALVVSGNAGNDTIRIIPQRGPQHLIRVVLNGSDLGTFKPTARVIVFGQSGDDDIRVSEGSALPMVLLGGEGKNRLEGASENDVLVGGDDDDILKGGDGRDMLFAGGGADIVDGGAGDDVLVAGNSFFNFVDDFLPNRFDDLMQEWTRTDQNYHWRVHHLLYGNGKNQGQLDVTSDFFVSDDAAVDSLTGGKGTDWFLRNSDGSAPDQLADRSGAETVSELLNVATG